MDLKWKRWDGPMLAALVCAALLRRLAVERDEPDGQLAQHAP
jgi:hypothetical protein